MEGGGDRNDLWLMRMGKWPLSQRSEWVFHVREGESEDERIRSMVEKVPFAIEK